MELEKFNLYFKENCEKNNIEYKQDKVKLLYDYMKLILEWNEKINLTSIKDEKEFCVKHFIDSLTLNKYINNAKLIDIGTGAGFPGIPLKIYNPEIKITLIDSVNKKIMVLNDIINRLALSDIEAIHVRAEELAKQKDYRESFDIATTRAVSNLTTICEYMIPFLKIGGKALCMKGPKIEEELTSSKNAISILGGEIINIENFNLNKEYERNLVLIKKKRKTDNIYPRGQGKPLKNPLK